MNLTRMIFDYWRHWLTLREDTILYALEVDTEGLFFYDWYNMTFWYALNHEWYKMNNKLYAYTGCKESYEEPMDFTDT